MSTIRLNKLLAIRGVGARRKCDRLIESGVVRVNGEVVTAPGARVVEGRDRITVSGRPLPERSTQRYLMLHKPVGVITTLRDPEGRRTVADLIPREGRLYPVGRLDADTSGLLIVTNDGALAHHLMHPRYGLTKFYRVLLAEEPSEGQLVRLQSGVEFEPGVRSAPARVRRRDPVPRGAVIEIALHEGRHRQVRRMCEAVGLRVLGLHRWAYGPLKLGELARGVWRELSEEEVAALRSASARARPRPARSGPGRPRGAGEGRAFAPGVRPGDGARPRAREFGPRRERPLDDARPRAAERRRPYRDLGTREERPRRERPLDDARPRAAERRRPYRDLGTREERPRRVARQRFTGESRGRDGRERRAGANRTAFPAPRERFERRPFAGRRGRAESVGTRGRRGDEPRGRFEAPREGRAGRGRFGQRPDRERRGAGGGRADARPSRGERGRRPRGRGRVAGRSRDDFGASGRPMRGRRGRRNERK